MFTCANWTVCHKCIPRPPTAAAREDNSFAILVDVGVDVDVGVFMLD